MDLYYWEEKDREKLWNACMLMKARFENQIMGIFQNEMNITPRQLQIFVDFIADFQDSVNQVLGDAMGSMKTRKVEDRE